MRIPLFFLILQNIVSEMYKFTTINTPKNEQAIYQCVTDKGTYCFYEPLIENKTTRVALHIPLLIQEIVRINEPIVYFTNKIKYTIKPFDEITMEVDGKIFCLGKYKSSFIKNGQFQQSYQNGTLCDLNNKNQRESIILYLGGIGNLIVEKFVEVKVCKYNFTVSSSTFTNIIKVQKNVDIFLKKTEKNKNY